jgi:hypothetical protein
MKKGMVQWVFGCLLLVIVQLLISCGQKAKATNVYVERIYGPDGGTCYVIMQDSNAVGGNCFKE